MMRAAIIVTALLSTACFGSRGRPNLDLDPEGHGAAAGSMRAPLPEGRSALLAEADKNASKGPSGPDLQRSEAAAQRLLSDAPKDGDAAWRTARAFYLQFLSAQSDGDPSLAQAMALRCESAAKSAVRAEAGAAGHYYAALCLGALAQVDRKRALLLIPKMVEHAERADALDPGVEYGGPARVLGGIYLRAPSWPASVGDPDEAIEQLERAVALAPEWPENHLLLAEAWLELEDSKKAAASLDRARRLMAAPYASGWSVVWSPDLRKLERQIR